MYDKKISLYLVAKALRVSMPYARVVLEGENVTPIQDCKEFNFVMYLTSDVQSCFPDVDFKEVA